MEPNLKEGVGGFRDSNLVFWIGKVFYNVNSIKNLPSNIVDEKEYRSFRIALEFLFRVRSALHLATGKKEDKLRLDLIPSIAKFLGYEESKQGHMKFAKKVTENLKIIRLYSTIWLDKLTETHVQADPEKNFIYSTTKDFHPLLKELCDHAKNPFYAHSSFIQQLLTADKPDRPDKLLYETIARFFHQPYSYYIFSALSFARLLKYVIPSIRKAVDLPQFDGYHQYAVDIHSMKCVYHLEHIEDPFIQNLFESLNTDEKAMLKLVTFLHDAGKGRKRDHHLVGASLFKIFAKKLQIDPELIKMGETLILFHTLMSKVAQREDLYSEAVILSFTSHFKTAKLLDMIYILTYADMSGVGNDVYNSFSAKLIRTLYKQSVQVLGQTKRLDEAGKRAKKIATLKRRKGFLSLSRTKQNKIIAIPSNLLFLRYTPKRILAITDKAFETKSYTCSISNETHLTIEIIRKESFNLSYLLGKLSNLDVVNMDICKLFNGLKYFKIDFSETISEEEVGFLEETIAKSFTTITNDNPFNASVLKKEIDIDCEHSKMYAIMNINAKDQKGLLAYIIDMFDAMGIDIVTAKVHTLKNRARDMFLIEKNGNFCHNTELIIDKLTGKS
jgi:[protein-PII] uridylyltransferase